MRKLALLAIAGGALLIGTIAAAQPEGSFRERLRERLAERVRQDQGNAPQVVTGQTIAYGADPAQRLDFWAAQGTKQPAPLVIFVHGGGWQRGSKDNATGQWKASHYPAQGYAFASIDYRLVPAATVEQQAADVAAAVKALIDRAATLGIDRRRVVLMGHSAGAQLVALIGTDEGYLRSAGLSFADLAGVIPIDGAAYDVAGQLQQAGPRMRTTYDQAFGSDPARQRLLSPTLQAGAPNARHFLLLHVQRDDGIRQTQGLAAALRQAGTSVEVASVPGQGLIGHMEINRRLGDPDYAPTATVDAWLRRVFGS